jgi:hypothetical protein
MADSVLSISANEDGMDGTPPPPPPPPPPPDGNGGEYDIVEETSEILGGIDAIPDKVGINIASIAVCLEMVGPKSSSFSFSSSPPVEAAPPAAAAAVAIRSATA